MAPAPSNLFFMPRYRLRSQNAPKIDHWNTLRPPDLAIFFANFAELFSISVVDFWHFCRHLGDFSRCSVDWLKLPKFRQKCTKNWPLKSRKSQLKPARRQKQMWESLLNWVVFVSHLRWWERTCKLDNLPKIPSSAPSPCISGHLCGKSGSLPISWFATGAQLLTWWCPTLSIDPSACIIVIASGGGRESQHGEWWDWEWQGEMMHEWSQSSGSESGIFGNWVRYFRNPVQGPRPTESQNPPQQQKRKFQ